MLRLLCAIFSVSSLLMDEAMAKRTLHSSRPDGIRRMFVIDPMDAVMVNGIVVAFGWIVLT